MGVRLSALALGLAALLATGALTYAADQRITRAPVPLPKPQVKPQTLIVPDVRRQAYVFAKGMLVDAGFAWRVKGSVRGFAANVVEEQEPGPGNRVLDNGAPTIVLTLSRNDKYPQKGKPQDEAPYPGTRVLPANSAIGPASLAPAPPTPKSLAKPAVKPGTKTLATSLAKPPPAANPAVEPATKTLAVSGPKPAAKPAVEPATKTLSVSGPKQAAKPAAKRIATSGPKPKTKHVAKADAAYPQLRPAAFSVVGAPKEPLDEMPLPDRARLLGRWLTQHPKPTNANVAHWLYQHEWIVQGAKFGWWRGVQALQILVEDDRRAEQAWGIGSKSQQVARAALAEVQARST
jgi:hypothetical protein